MNSEEAARTIDLAVRCIEAEEQGRRRLGREIVAYGIPAIMGAALGIANTLMVADIRAADLEIATRFGQELLHHYGYAREVIAAVAAEVVAGYCMVSLIHQENQYIGLRQSTAELLSRRV